MDPTLPSCSVTALCVTAFSVMALFMTAFSVMALFMTAFSMTAFSVTAFYAKLIPPTISKDMVGLIRNRDLFITTFSSPHSSHHDSRAIV
jgi:hypothetical protein